MRLENTTGAEDAVMREAAGVPATVLGLAAIIARLDTEITEQGAIIASLQEQLVASIEEVTARDKSIEDLLQEVEDLEIERTSHDTP